MHLKVVGLGRLELPTSPLSGVRSNQLSYKPIFLAFVLLRLVSSFVSHILACMLLPHSSSRTTLQIKCLQKTLFKLAFRLYLLGVKIGGAKQDRTADLLNANQALSQLSYSPIFYFGFYSYSSPLFVALSVTYFSYASSLTPQTARLETKPSQKPFEHGSSAFHCSLVFFSFNTKQSV